MRDRWQREYTTRSKKARRRNRKASGYDEQGLPERSRRRKLTELAEEETERMLELVQTGEESPD
jgi:hypothetical protein